MQKSEINYEYTYTKNLPNILDVLGVSIVFTSTTLAKVVKLSSFEDTLKISNTDIDIPIFVDKNSDKIIVSSLDDILVFKQESESYILNEKIELDKSVGIRDIKSIGDDIFYVNSKNSSIEKISGGKVEEYFKADNISSFTCRGSKPRYVTIKNTIYDILTNQVIVNSMSNITLINSINNKLIFCEEDLMQICEYDFQTQSIRVIFKLTSLINSITLLDSILIVAHSKNLSTKSPYDSHSGFTFVNLKDGSTIATFYYEDSVIDINSLCLVSSSTCRDILMSDSFKTTTVSPIAYERKTERFPNFELLKGCTLKSRFSYNNYKFINNYRKNSYDNIKAQLDELFDKNRDYTSYNEKEFGDNNLLYTIHNKQKIIGAVTFSKGYFQKEFVYIVKVLIDQEARDRNLFLVSLLATIGFAKNSIDDEATSIMFSTENPKIIKNGVKKRVFEKYGWKLASNEASSKICYNTYKYLL